MNTKFGGKSFFLFYFLEAEDFLEVNDKNHAIKKNKNIYNMILLFMRTFNVCYFCHHIYIVNMSILTPDTDSLPSLMPFKKYLSHFLWKILLRNMFRKSTNIPPEKPVNASVVLRKYLYFMTRREYFRNKILKTTRPIVTIYCFKHL